MGRASSGERWTSGRSACRECRHYAPRSAGRDRAAWPTTALDLGRNKLRSFPQVIAKLRAEGWRKRRTSKRQVTRRDDIRSYDTQPECLGRISAAAKKARHQQAGISSSSSSSRCASGDAALVGGGGSTRSNLLGWTRARESCASPTTLNRSCNHVITRNSLCVAQDCESASLWPLAVVLSSVPRCDYVPSCLSTVVLAMAPIVTCCDG